MMGHFEKNLSCFGCDEKFPSFLHMVLHLESGTCQSRLTSDELWRWSAGWFSKYSPRSLENIREQTFRCTVCSKTFQFLSLLISHMTVYHGPDSMASWSGLRHHLASKGSSVGPTTTMNQRLCETRRSAFHERTSLQRSEPGPNFGLI